MSETLINPNQINLGNESAVDLLIQQNQAKVNLANNLNGLGVSANANTESLNQLVSKVADVQADTTKQNIEGIVVDTISKGVNGMAYHFVTKNGFVFYIVGTTLIYAKQSDLKANASSYLTDTPVPSTTISSFCTTSTPSSGNDQIYRRLFFTDDGQYLYVLNFYTPTIQRYTVTWGADYSTVAFSDMLTITVQNNGSNVNVDYLDISADKTKLLLTIWYQNAFHPAILDLTDIETTPTRNVTMFSGSANDAKNTFFFTENESYPICEFLQGYCRVYAVEGNNIILHETKTFKISQSNPYQFRRGLLKYKDKKGNYHIICSVGYCNDSNETSEEYAYVMVNSTTANIIQYRCYIPRVSGLYYYADSITVYEKNNKYYLFCGGMCYLCLDEDWNVLGNVTIPLNWSTNNVRFGFIYDDDFYVLLAPNASTFVQNYDKVKIYLDKKVAVAKNVSIGGETKQVIMFAQPTSANIDTGIYD